MLCYNVITLFNDKYNKYIFKKRGLGGLCPYLNLSCPAVSHIWSLTILLTTLMIFEPNSTPMVWFDSSLTRKQNKATQVGIPIEGTIPTHFQFFIFFHSSFEWGSLTSWLIVKELHQWPGISKFSTLFYSFLQKSLISASRWNWCFVGFSTWLERDKNKVATRQSQKVQQIPLCGVVTNLGQPHTHTHEIKTGV